MSARFMVKAMCVTTGSPTRKLVLIKLADNANDDGTCWPSLKHIAEDCEITTRSVRDQINHLKKLGFVSIQSRYADGRQKSNYYQLHLDGGRGNEVPPGGNEVPGEGERGSSPGGNDVPPIEPVRGTCNRTKEKTRASKKPTTDELMAEIPAGVDQSLWSDWIEHRQEIKKPLTIRAARALATQLKKFQANGHSADDVLRQSIINGWQGVFEPKEKPKAKTKKRKELL